MMRESWKGTSWKVEHWFFFVESMCCFASGTGTLRSHFQPERYFRGKETHSNKVRRSKSYLSKLRSGFFNIYASEDRMNTFTILSLDFFIFAFFVFKGFLLGPWLFFFLLLGTAWLCAWWFILTWSGRVW